MTYNLETFNRLSSIIPTLVEFKILNEGCDWQELEELKNKWGIETGDEDLNLYSFVAMHERMLFIDDYRDMVEKIIRENFDQSKAKEWF